jgi:dTDP-4-amino-4,6-dideoxygalactose transaminase
MGSIMEFARIHGLYVIEDNAQALGADFFPEGAPQQKAGSIGHVGCTSFFPSKNLGAFGDGGAIFTDDPGLGKRIASLVNHGMDRRYYYDHVGVNSRLDTLQAAILRVKLAHLDAYHLSRQEAAAWYDATLSDLPGVSVPKRSAFSSHIFHQYTLRLPASRRDALRHFLQEKEIPSMVYYPVPLHLQKAYLDLGYAAGDLPVSEALCNQVLSLPMHTELGKDQLEYISEQIVQFFKS